MGTKRKFAHARTPERVARVRAVLARRQPDLRLLFENVHDDHNLNAVLRTADAAGVLYVHTVGHLEIHRRITGGSHKWLQIVEHETLDEAVAALRAAGCRVYATALRPDATPFRELDMTQPIAFILGNEHEGVSQKAIDLSDGTVVIPMYGMVQSLNVSVAAAVLLYEAERQRRAAGMYDAPRLDRETFARLERAWLEK